MMARSDMPRCLLRWRYKCLAALGRLRGVAGDTRLCQHQRKQRVAGPGD